MIIHSPLFFLLILVVIFVASVYLKLRRHTGIIFPSDAFFQVGRFTWRSFLYEHIWLLRILVLLLLVLGLVRFRLPVEGSKIKTEGIDIVLALDVSTSMLAEDFTLRGRRVNRLEAVKDVVEKFIQGRNNDRIGVVAFAARAYTVSPLTLDYAWLLNNLKRVKIGMIEDGTAIGSGIVVALKRLNNSPAKGKVIILLTDGINNAGNVSPLTAAQLAKSLKVRVYTIGAGTKGLVPYPVKDFFGNTVYRAVKIDLDENILKEIAQITDAKYFRATDTKSLKEIYSEIDQMEKSPLEQKGFNEYEELFARFVYPALFLLVLEAVLLSTWLRKIP